MASDRGLRSCGVSGGRTWTLYWTRSRSGWPRSSLINQVRRCSVSSVTASRSSRTGASCSSSRRPGPCWLRGGDEPVTESTTDDALDVSLEDGDLLDEVELLANVFIAADEAHGRPLDQARIDRALGLRR